MTKRDNYETLMLREESSREGKQITLYSVFLCMDGAETALKEHLTKENYDPYKSSYGLSYVMGQIRYASAMDTDSPYTFSDWVGLYEIFKRAKKEFEATQIKWTDERNKWIFRKTSAKGGDIHTVLHNPCPYPYLTPKMQKMLCYMADNDLF